jgi:hypothetical protein
MVELKEYIPIEVKNETEYEHAVRLYEEAKCCYEMKVLNGELSIDEKHAWERGLEFQKRAIDILKPKTCVIF